MSSNSNFYKSKVTARYQISIPKEIREKLGIKEGDYVTFRVDNGHIIVGKGEFTVSEKCKD
jgi:AbrB family looped-hinge helix DNA binding protein